jgi:hypothetical protein
MWRIVVASTLLWVAGAPPSEELSAASPEATPRLVVPRAVAPSQ